MKILITGGAGFIGSNLGFYLMEKGHTVTLIDNLKFGYIDNLIKNKTLFPNFISLDIRDTKLEKVMNNIDVVFHLAGISSLPECNSNPKEAYDCNVAGTANVLECARKSDVKKIIFSSTSAVYENTTVFPSEESQEVYPSLIYSLTKKNCEELCKSYIDMYGMNITILRFFNVYGPHMDYLRPNPPLVSYIIKCLLMNKSPLLHSDGKQARDMIYVQDVIDLCEIVMTNEKANNEIFNVGSGSTTTVQKIFDIIANAFNNTSIKPTYRNPIFIWEKYPDLINGQFPLQKKILAKEVNKYTLASTQKTLNCLKWRTKISIEEGLNRTVKFAVENQKIRNLKLKHDEVNPT